MDLIPATIVPSLFRSTFALVPGICAGICMGIGMGLGTPTSAAPPSNELEPDPSQPFVFAREIWNRTASAEDLQDPRTFEGVPDRSELIEVPIGAQGLGDGFVQRIRGWIEPPETGSYRFAVTSDDDSVLLISPGGDASLARPVASVTGFTGPDDFGGGEGISGPITLIRGQPCHIEARHRDVAGADHLVVGWKVPRSGHDRPIPIGTVLEPRFRLEVWEGVPSGAPGVRGPTDSIPADIRSGDSGRHRLQGRHPTSGKLVGPSGRRLSVHALGRRRGSA